MIHKIIKLIFFKKKISKITFKILFLIIFISSFFSLIATSAQVYLNYRYEIRSVDTFIDFVKKHYLRTLAISSFKIDYEQTKIILNTIAVSPYVAKSEIQEKRSNTLFKLTSKVKNIDIKYVKNFLLMYKRPSGESVQVGTLFLYISYDLIYSKIIDNTFTILASNLIKSFIVAFFILFAIEKVSTRHLHKIASFTNNIDYNNLNKNLSLNRKKNPKNLDEFDLIVKSVNKMINRLANSFNILEDEISKKERLNKKLESSYEELEKSYKELNDVQKELETSNSDLENALLKAEEVNVLKSEFLAMMSHELRTPLSGMLGFSDLLSKDASLTKKQKAHVEFINKSGKRLLNVLSDLLEISVIEAGKVIVEISEFDIELVIDDIYILLTEKFKESNIEFIKDISVEKQIRSDQSRIRQILFNLIGNAVKFTEIGSVKVRVRDDEKNYIFTVEDTGIGIDDEQIKFIFDMFKQVEGAFNRKYQGTGLGLAICKRLVEALNGNIWVRSNLNHGSRFYFTIPKTSIINSDSN